ncbi:MAG: YkgJ family cysteine cluster protein [Candidatus Jordarchaeaceae archaeon]
MNRIKFPEGVRFECQKCSRCCAHTEVRSRRILLSDFDTLRIEKNLGLRRGEFADFIRDSHPFTYLMKMVNGKCIFLSEDKTCKIYEFRPIICRCFPFWIEKRGNLFEFKVSLDCPGIGKGNSLGEAFFRKLLNEAVKAYHKVEEQENF